MGWGMTNHDPLWGEGVHRLDDFLYLTSLDPCPIPVSGKMATAVSFTVTDAWAAARYASDLECFARDTMPSVRNSDHAPHTEWNVDVLNGITDGTVRASCPVLEEYIRAGGSFGAGNSRIGYRGVIHLSGTEDSDWMNSLCGASPGYDCSGHGFSKGLTEHLWARPESAAEPIVYKVCSNCRRTAEARKKREYRKPDPKIKAAKLLAEEQKRAAEIQKMRAAAEAREAAREAKYQKELAIAAEGWADTQMALIDSHYGIPHGQAKREELRAAILSDYVRRWR